MWLVDRYKVLHEIGRGGTSVVVLAFDNIDMKQYVIKILKKYQETISFKVIKQAFQNEVDSLNKLQDSRICNLKDAFEDMENFYIVLDYIEGVPLASYIQQSVDKQLMIKFMYQLLAILHYIHSCGVYHMDIKPQNILVNDETVYLIDFGSSHLATSGYKVRCATPAYTAKEVLEGTLPDESADVYSFGITFYVMLYQRFPAMDVADSKLTRFLLTCCAANKAQRFQNFKEVKQNLDKIVTSTILLKI